MGDIFPVASIINPQDLFALTVVLYAVVICVWFFIFRR